MRLEPSGELFEKCYPEWTRATASLIVDAPAGTSFGLYARWGAGKSSACDALARAIYAAAHRVSKIVQVVTLNAYQLRAASAQTVHTLLNAELQSSLSASPKDARQVKALFELISKFIPSSLTAASAVGLPHASAGAAAIKVLANLGAASADARLEAEKTRIVEDLNVDRVILVVDDLDRCTPAEALHVLTQCADPVSARSANAVIACDPEVLATHAAHAFGISRLAGLEAISKYVHAPLYLPTGCTDSHREILQSILNSTADEALGQLVDAAFDAVGIVPMREIRAALPQARLWLARISDLHDGTLARDLARPLLYAALLAVILPDVVRAAQCSPESFYRLSALVREGPRTEKRELKEVLSVFGNTVVDAIRLRPDLVTLGLKLVPPWSGDHGIEQARHLAYLISGFRAAPTRPEQ